MKWGHFTEIILKKSRLTKWHSFRSDWLKTKWNGGQDGEVAGEAQTKEEEEERERQANMSGKR